MESPCTAEEGQRRRIDLSFALHKQAVKDARLHPEGRTAIIVDEEPLNTNVAPTPTRHVPAQSKRKCKHLTPKLKCNSELCIRRQQLSCSCQNVWSLSR